MRTIVSTIGLCVLLALASAQPFTYQGFLRQGGAPLTNPAQPMTFRIYDALTGGTLLWDSGTVNVDVNNGLFTVPLNAPTSVWTGADRFLEIRVGSTTLSPRVKITPTPYAIRANTAGTANPIGSAGGDLAGPYPNPIVDGLQSRPVSGAVPASGQVLKWDGSAWAPAADNVGGLTLPFSGSANATGAVFSITNTAPSGITYGGRFQSSSTDGRGVFGYATATSGPTHGVLGMSDSTSGRGVFGWSIATSGTNYGVYGRSNSTASSAYGVIGEEPPGGAGHAVFASGTFAATGTKSFQIDHPLMPETHYLNHFCTEGPEPYNLYRGTVVLGARGEAWVQLPDYFEAINRDPSYHLTPVGAPMPNLHVAVEVQGNRFKIAGGAPGKKVSWEVKAIRNDRWVQEYGYQTVQEKEDEIKGKYLNPELYGQPKGSGIHYRPEPERPQDTKTERPQ